MRRHAGERRSLIGMLRIEPVDGTRKAAARV